MPRKTHLLLASFVIWERLLTYGYCEIRQREFCHCNILSDVQTSLPAPEMTLSQWFSGGPQTRRSSLTREPVRKVNSAEAAPAVLEAETLCSHMPSGHPGVASNLGTTDQDKSQPNPRMTQGLQALHFSPCCLQTDSNQYSSGTPNPHCAVPCSRLSTLLGLLKTSY